MTCSPAADLEQQSLPSDPDESYLKDLPEFPSVEELPSLEHHLLRPAPSPSEGEPLSPASLLIQHLASPLHFVNTHFNGHGRPPPGGEQEQAPGAQTAQQSLEALSEEIVSTAISTVVQNTLSALLRLGDERAEPDEDLETGDGAEGVAAGAVPDDTLVAAEEEDFELLDQSELEQVDEDLDLGLGGHVGRVAPDTHRPHS